MDLVGTELDEVEPDDLLASQTHMLSRAGHDVLIVSADKDFAQCVDDRVKCVMDKFGVGPAQIAEYLALIGDTSDNIPVHQDSC
jgi:DNA polymerase-1